MAAIRTVWRGLVFEANTRRSGTVYGDGTFGLDWDKVETDADGNSVGLNAPVSFPTESNDLYTSGWSFGTFSTGQSHVYVVDGIPMACEQAWSFLSRSKEAIADITFLDDLNGVFSDVAGRTELRTLDTIRFGNPGGGSLVPDTGGHVCVDGVCDEEKVTSYRTEPFSNFLLSFGSDDQEACDTRLAKIFGDDDAVVATANEPLTLLRRNGERDIIAGMNRINPGGLANPRESPTNGVAHLYALPSGYGKVNGFAYTPRGYVGKPSRVTALNPNSNGEIQTNFVFTYLPGSLRKFGYNGGLRINFVHSGTTDAKGNLLPPDASVTNSIGSIKVGVIGNYGVDFATGGNSDGTFVHDHLLFNTVNNKGKIGARIDPRKVFCSDLGF